MTSKVGSSQSIQTPDLSAQRAKSQTFSERMWNLWRGQSPGKVQEHLQSAQGYLTEGRAQLASALGTLSAMPRPIAVVRPQIQAGVFAEPTPEEKTEWRPPPPPGPPPPESRNIADASEEKQESPPAAAPPVEEQTVHKDYPLYSFLKICLFSIDRRTTGWSNLSELEPYKEAIEEFYKQEFQLREIFPVFSLKQPKNWLKAEKILKDYDRPHLSTFMKHLKEALENPEYLDEECEELPQIKQSSDLPEDCFEALWEMILEPRILRRLKILKLDPDEPLEQIPVGFSWLSFGRLKELSFADHPIGRLPKKVRTEFQWIDGKKQPIGKPRHFFDGCPLLEILDFSCCDLIQEELYHLFSFSFFFGEYRTEVVEEQGVYVEKTIQVRELMPALKRLKKIDLRNNLFTDFPLVFKIHPDRLERSLVIDMRNNAGLQSFSETLLQDLGSSSPIQITLDVRNNQILESSIEKSDTKNPSNVHLLYGTESMKADIPRLLREESKNSPQQS